MAGARLDPSVLRETIALVTQHGSVSAAAREFRPHGDTGKRYLLDEIPAGLWADVRAKAKRDGVSLRTLILRLLKEWLER